MQRILVTGGLGYIGAHTCVALAEAGYHPVVIDNLLRSEISVKIAIEEITGKSLEFYEIDAKDFEKVKKSIGNIDGVIHFAALKSASDSIINPSDYYTENLDSLLSIINVANDLEAQSFIFSSSATVYGDTKETFVNEETILGHPLNPYGHTKVLGERILKSGKHKFKSILLRYFNPVGAHESAKIGELPIDIPSNLVPFITQTASLKRERLTIFGNDYNTKDGTCIRDFIHVQDLAEAHVAAIKYSQEMKEHHDIFNVGTGEGHTVLELVRIFEKVNRIKLNFKFGPRRIGDIESIHADTSKIEKVIGWRHKRNIETCMRSSWQWEKNFKTKEN